MICLKLMAFCDLGLVNPFGHPLQVRTQVLVVQSCADLHRLVSLFGQGLNVKTVSLSQPRLYFKCSAIPFELKGIFVWLCSPQVVSRSSEHLLSRQQA